MTKNDASEEQDVIKIYQVFNRRIQACFLITVQSSHDPGNAHDTSTDADFNIGIDFDTSTTSTTSLNVTSYELELDYSTYSIVKL